MIRVNAQNIKLIHQYTNKIYKFPRNTLKKIFVIKLKKNRAFNNISRKLIIRLKMINLIPI